MSENNDLSEAQDHFLTSEYLNGIRPEADVDSGLEDEGTGAKDQRNVCIDVLHRHAINTICPHCRVSGADSTTIPSARGAYPAARRTERYVLPCRVVR